MYAWIHVNRNYNLAALNLFHFLRFPSGDIEGHYVSETTKDFYDRPADYFRLLLEILFILVTCWFLYQILKSMFKIYLKIMRKRYSKQSDYMKKQGWIRYLYLDSKIIREKD